MTINLSLFFREGHSQLDSMTFLNYTKKRAPNEPPHDAMQFFNYLNTKHPNIRFTFEKENNGKLPFLDVLIDNSKDKLITSIFHKKLTLAF